MEPSFPTVQRWVNREIPLPAVWPRSATATQRHALLGLIALSIEENVPLVTLLEQWAQDERGFQRRRVRRLARLLKSGRPLAEAVEEIHGILSDDDLLAIRFDAQLGTRTSAVRRVLSDAPPAGDPARRARRAVVYFAAMLLIALVIFAFLQLKIVPVFNKMFQEFAYPQPQMLEWSMTVARGIQTVWWLIPLALLALAWGAFSTQTGRFLRNSVLSRVSQPLRELHAADVLQKLGIASESGRPIPGALSTLARYHFVPDVRHKLLFVRNEVELGAEVWTSMNDVGLLNPSDLRLLKTAERVGNRSWALDQLAAVKQRQTRLRLQAAAQFVLPAIVLLLAGVVLFQALTILGPLVKLIEGNL